MDKTFKCDYCKKEKDNKERSNKTHTGEPVCKTCKDLFIVLDI